MVRLDNAEEVQQEFLRIEKQLGKPVVLAVEEAFENIGLRWQSDMRQRVRSGSGRFDQGSVPFTRTGAPRSRSGTLRNSFEVRTKGRRLQTLTLQAFSTAGVVAWVQEFGTKGKNPSSPIATIRPKTAKFLTIPLPGALTPGGRLRKGARGARDFKNSFFVRKGSKLTLVQASGNYQDKITPIFSLVKKVDLQPRLGMTETFSKVINRRLLRELDAAVEKFLLGRFSDGRPAKGGG